MKTKRIHFTFDKQTFKLALRSCVPVILGYLPTGFGFGLMLTSEGYHFTIASLMSLFMYAGAGQYLAVNFLVHNVGLLQIGLLTFLVNSKHLFYGLSLLEDYRNSGWRKPYLMFSLTDETYALLTEPNNQVKSNRVQYCFYVSIINHGMWIFSTMLGALLGSLVHFDVTGLEFAMTALFIVIMLDQWKVYKSKLPFLLGTLCTIVAVFLVGKTNMLLVGTIFSGIFLILFRKRIEKQ